MTLLAEVSVPDWVLRESMWYQVKQLVSDTIRVYDARIIPLTFRCKGWESLQRVHTLNQISLPVESSATLQCFLGSGWVQVQSLHHFYEIRDERRKIE